MKTILYIMTAMLLSLGGFGQADSTWHTEFRQLALKDLIDNNPNLPQLFELCDSLDIKNSKLVFEQVDSIATMSDSMNLDWAHNSRACAEMEKHFWYEKSGNSSLSLNAMKNALEYLEGYGEEEDFYPKVNEYLVGKFQQSGDMPSALKAQQNIVMHLQFLRKADAHEARYTEEEIRSQHAVETTQKNKELQKAQSEKQMFMYALIGAGALLLVILFTLFIQRYRLSSKLKAANQKKADTTELDALAVKVSKLQAENQQFKTTAQQAIQRLNTMDASHRQMHTEVRQLGEELNAALTEMRLQSEQVKTKVDPPTYMGLQNVVTRLGSTVQQRMSAINELLVK